MRLLGRREKNTVIRTSVYNFDLLNFIIPFVLSNSVYSKFLLRHFYKGFQKYGNLKNTKNTYQNEHRIVKHISSTNGLVL